MDSTRLGIPVIPVLEGIHGAVQDGCTIFPQAIAQGATFNPQLVERMARHVGRETQAIGGKTDFSARSRPSTRIKMGAC